MRYFLPWCFFACLMAVEPEKNNEPAPPRITVVVAEFQNRHPLLEQDWLASACADLVASALSSASRDVASGITVLDRSGIAALEQESRIAGEGATAQGTVANHVLGGSFTVSDERLVVEVALSTAGQQRWSQRLEGTVDQVPTLARRIAAGALAALSARVTMPAVGDARAVRDLPLAALVTLQRGRAAAARGDHAWAIADLLRTCKLAPHHGEAWLALGSSFEALGRPAAALAAWEQAVTVDPDDPGMAVALFRLARAQEERRPEYAQRLYERLLRDYPYGPAPLDLTGPQFNGPAITLAELAGKRLAQLVLVVPPPDNQKRQAGDHAVVGAPRGVSAPVVGQLIRRINQITEKRARNEYADPENELLLRLAVWSAAGGWPEGWPVVRLVDGQPVTARVGQAHFDVAPPPGMAIDRLTFAPAPRPGAPAGPYRFNLWTHTISEVGGSGRDLVSTKDGEPVTVTIPPNFALGFSASGYVTTVGRKATGTSIADLQLTAALRPVRPGALWITTQPPGALISIDNIPRGVTPCRIGDLAPGPLRVKADSLVTRPSASNDRPIQSYLHFADEADITVAGSGETRVEWTLTHRPQPTADGWSALRPILPAPPGTDVLGVTISWNERPPLYRPQVITHAKAGTVLFWQQDGEVRAATTHDARTWKALTSLPFNSGADESLSAVAVSPQGLILVAFRRGDELWSVTSSDLAGWTPPVRIAEVQSEDDRGSGQRRVAGVVWSSAGHFVVVYRTRNGDRQHTATSSDGRTWSTALTPLVHPDAWWPNASIALQRFSDGAPALLAIARLDKEKQKQAVIVRFALGPNGWTVRDQSPPFERSRTHEGDASLLANDADGSVHLVSRSGNGVRWIPGGDLQATSGLAVLGTELAITAAPGGALMVVPWAGSWWMATSGNAQATTVAPQITYEIPPVELSTSSTTPAPVLAATEVAAKPGSPIPANSVPITVPAENPQAVNEPARRGRSPLIIVLVLGVVVLLSAGITWWWWGFLKRRREEPS
jgi:tetratricopeptide (TPR) repeat protein